MAANRRASKHFSWKEQRTITNPHVTFLQNPWNVQEGELTRTPFDRLTNAIFCDLVTAASQIVLVAYSEYWSVK